MNRFWETALVLAEHVGWTVFHSLWQIALLAVPFGVLLVLIRGAQARYRLAYLALMVMAVVPVFSGVWSYSPSVRQSAVEPIGTEDVVALSTADAGEPFSPSQTTVTPMDPVITAQGDLPVVEMAATTGSDSFPRTSLAIGLAVFWLAGVIVLSIRQIGGWMLALRVVRNAVDVESAVTHECLKRLAKSMKIDRCIRLLQSAEIHTPMVIGFLRPCLIVPVSLLSGLTPDQLTTLFAHELAHLRRNDFLQNLLQTVIETVLFYHPAVWWMSKIIRTEREHLCDDASVAVVGKPIRLAEALASVQALQSPTVGAVPHLAQTATNDKPSAVLDRVRRLVASSAPTTVNCHRPSIANRVLVAFGAIATFCLLVPLAIAVQNDEPDATAAEEIADDSPPQPWEISKIYDAAFLRSHLMDYEALPKSIVVPAVRGRVVNSKGRPVSEANLVSHTPRQWVRLSTLMNNPRNLHGSFQKTKAGGAFGLPERKEPYRVLVVHDDGVASVSHEELIRAQGKIVLQKWATVSGTFTLGGKAQAAKTVKLFMNTVPWSYSRGGPRLTTDYETTTDAEGRFSFDRVIPLAGRAHIVEGAIGYGTKYQCESGRETKIDIGVGGTALGRLRFGEDVESEKVQVRITPVGYPLPYPKELAENGTANEKREWRKKWTRTKEGFALTDKNFDLMNSRIPGTVNPDGRFVVYGLQRGQMNLRVFVPKKGTLFEKEFYSTGVAGEEIGLGDLFVGEGAEEAAAQAAANDSLPAKMVVKTVDVDGNPVAGARVRFWDFEGYFHGGKMEFEMVDRTTNDVGIADLGRLPREFGRLQVLPFEEYSGCYNVISAGSKATAESNPPRANMRFEQHGDEVTVTVTLTPRVDLEFKILDEETGEIVFWPEVFYQDSDTDRWWLIGMVDGSKRLHNFIPFSPKITRETIKIFTVGYETKTIQFPADLDLSEPIRREVTLRPLPEVEFTVQRSNGKPAKFAQLRFDYPNGLDTLQSITTKTDDKGVCRTKFPPAAEFATMRITHLSETLSTPLKSLLDEATAKPDATVRRTLTLEAK